MRTFPPGLLRDRAVGLSGRPGDKAEESEDDTPLAARKRPASRDRNAARKKARRAVAPAEASSGSPDFLSLPDEVWLAIMQRLPRPALFAVGSAARRLLQLSRDPSLWRALTIDWQAIKAQEEGKGKLVNQVIQRATMLHTLMVKNKTFEQIKSQAVAAVARRAGPSLRQLTFSPEVVLSNSAVATLGGLSGLTSLELPGDWLKTAAAQAIGSLAHLNTLKLPGAEQLTSSDLVAMVSSLPNMRVLDLSDAKKGMTDSVLTALAAAAPGLEYLALDECERVTGRGVKALADRCSRLTHLSLDGCYQVNDPSIMKVAGACHQLAYLSLSLCSTVKDTSLKALAANCPALAHLNLFGCAYISERGVSRLVEALGPRALRYLDIRGMLGVGRAFSERLAGEWPAVEVTHQFLPKPPRDRAKKY
jgi:hypothetical protein